MAQNQNQTLAAQGKPTNNINQLKVFAEKKDVVDRFVKCLGSRADKYIASIIQVVGTNPDLALCRPQTLLACAVQAAQLNLQLLPSLGQAALVPFKEWKKEEDGKYTLVGVDCQLLIMVKGWKQLAIRSKQFKSMNSFDVYEDEFLGYDPFRGIPNLQAAQGGYRDKNMTDKIVGYGAYFLMADGFEHWEYWSKSKVLLHAREYSKSWDKKTKRFRYGSAWADRFDAMARKTVIKMALSNWGLLSPDLEEAIIADQATFTDPNDLTKLTYRDNPATDAEKTGTDALSEESGAVLPVEQENPATTPDLATEEYLQEEDFGQW